ncbi:MAG TPA: hypothetical protein VN690_04675 [Terriglobales bacterium]|nr:hypothetical protein [Terriglobales bacterium]
MNPASPNSFARPPTRWNANIDQWKYATGTPLARKTGVHGYYLRLAPPEVLETGSVTDVILKLKNRPEGETPPPAAAVVSPDALGLVRYGLRSAQDPRILDTIKVIDATLKCDLATGPAWHRYTIRGVAPLCPVGKIGAKGCEIRNGQDAPVARAAPPGNNAGAAPAKRSAGLGPRARKTGRAA